MWELKIQSDYLCALDRMFNVSCKMMRCNADANRCKIIVIAIMDVGEDPFRWMKKSYGEAQVIYLEWIAQNVLKKLLVIGKTHGF
jgi:hypothetical protein